MCPTLSSFSLNYISRFEAIFFHLQTSKIKYRTVKDFNIFRVIFSSFLKLNSVHKEELQQKLICKLF